LAAKTPLDAASCGGKTVTRLSIKLLCVTYLHSSTRRVCCWLTKHSTRTSPPHPLTPSPLPFPPQAVEHLLLEVLPIIKNLLPPELMQEFRVHIVGSNSVSGAEAAAPVFAHLTSTTCCIPVAPPLPVATCCYCMPLSDPCLLTLRPHPALSQPPCSPCRLPPLLAGARVHPLRRGAERQRGAVPRLAV
jgi:hypothetical protein